MNKQRSKKTYRSFASIVLVSALATTSFGIATTSQSAVRRLAAVSACKEINGFTNPNNAPHVSQDSISDTGNGWFGYMLYDDGPSTALCTIPSSSTLLHNNISNVTVSGFQASGHDLDLRVCSYDWDSLSYDCGNWKDAGSGERFFNASISDLSPLTDHSSWFPLLLAEGMVAPSNLKGIYISG